MLEFSISVYLMQLMVLLSIFDPTISTEEISNIKPPAVHIVSQEYYISNICTCTCPEDNIYGRFYLDSNGIPTLLMVTDDGVTIPHYSIGFDAVTIHELTHYIQYIQGKWGNIEENGVPTYSDEEFDELTRRMERQAYENQNKFLNHHHIPTSSIEEKIEWSVKSNTENCDEDKLVSTK